MSRLSPFYRLIFFILSIAIVASSRSIISIFLSILFFIALIALSDINKKEVFRPLYKARHFLLLTFFLNALFSEEGTLFSFWFIRVSKEGLINSFMILYHVILITLFAYAYTLSSKINEISDALMILFSPLKLLFIPVDKIASALSLSLYLIDEFIAESEWLKRIRKIRGNGTSKGIKERAREYKAIVIPIFIMAFKRSDELSFALLSRGYNAKAKVRGEYLRPSLRDLLAMFITILILIGVNI